VVQEDTTSSLLKLLHDYEIDFALASLPIDAHGLEIRELFSEELLLALPAGHALAGKRAVAPADLGGERLIVMKEGHCLGDQVLGFCGRRDVKPKISFRSSQIETIQALVVSGLGISLIPSMAIQPGGAYRSFRPPKPSRKIVAVWTKHRPPGRAATEFLNLLSAPSRAKTNAKPPRK
jgi:LysR family hydrogen peroxide-inducible transcriptional activator